MEYRIKVNFGQKKFPPQAMLSHGVRLEGSARPRLGPKKRGKSPRFWYTPAGRGIEGSGVFFFLGMWGGEYVAVLSVRKEGKKKTRG